MTYEERYESILRSIKRAKELCELLEPKVSKPVQDKDRDWHDKQVEDDYRTEHDEYWKQRREE